jgi:hypothetical protein
MAAKQNKTETPVWKKEKKTLWMTKKSRKERQR